MIATDPHLLGKSVFYTLLPPPPQPIIFLHQLKDVFMIISIKKQNIFRGGGYFLKIAAAYIKICTFTKGDHYQKLYQKKYKAL